MSFEQSQWDSDVIGDKMHSDLFKKKIRIRREKIKLKPKEKVSNYARSKLNTDALQNVQLNRTKFNDKIIKKKNVMNSKKNIKKNLSTSFKKIMEKQEINKRGQLPSKQDSDSGGKEVTQIRQKRKRPLSSGAPVAGLNISSLKKKLGEKVLKRKTMKSKSKCDQVAVAGERVAAAVAVVDLNISSLKKQLASSLQKGQSMLRQSMLDKLDAARFRFLNEQLYTVDGAAARRLFAEDPSAFGAYHQGYRLQVSRWPLNPLDSVIAALRALPAELVVADLGCGDARLARSVPQRVHSFDLVAGAAGVVACDMARLPLADGQAHVAVFCLSLMGTNLGDYLLEANRVLALGGLLKIAEVESRFRALSPDGFLQALQGFGFQEQSRDLSHDLFYFFDLTKRSHVTRGGKRRLPALDLLPCLYKKR